MKFRSTGLRALAVSVSGVALAVAAPTLAQETPAEQVDAANGQCALDAQGNPIPTDPDCATVPPSGGANAEEGAIIVTGSRIQRNTSYNSISPLQVLETQTLQDTGQFDAAAILQQTESAAGTQIDATFQGFVLNNGPGSQTLDLRGLGADRTLLLVNGRRLAPAGVEGAPTNPSINLIPSSLVARYDLLLDGASSVYGSDAVAGVGNIVLRKDLDGFEIFASGNKNEQGGGDDYQISGAWGKRGSNWQFGIGAEYSKRDEVRYADRDFLAGCDRNYEIDQNGNILTVGISADANTRRLSNNTIREVTSECKLINAARRIIPSSSPAGAGGPGAVGLFFSSIYYDPRTFASSGTTGNTGIPNFTDSLDAFGRPVDRNGDGLLDVDFTQVTRNGLDTEVSLIAPQDLYNVMAYGEYTFEGDWNITPFFEANYSRADVSARGNVPQLFPVVGFNNPFNPCNINTVNGVRVNPNGVDCGLAQNRFDNLTGTVNARPLGRSYTVQPVVNVRGDRNFVETQQEQYRGVFGVRGDLPFINFGPGNDWTFEIAGVHSYSKGTSSRVGIRNDRLALALGLDPTRPNPTGNATPFQLAGGPCATSGFFNPALIQPDLQAGCVPVNLFAPSLYDNIIGDFATEAERNYLFDSRDFDTRYKQTLVSAFLQGSVFKLPGGDAKAVIGAEWRKDSLKSLPDAVAAQGLFFGFFSDQGAVGSKTIKEVFGELDLPLVTGETMAEEVRLNVSGRLTDDEFYGTNETYSIKFGWRPIKPLLFKLSYGTSFRAPNLRENFLAGQSGFGGITDPCAVPTAAYAPLGGGYNAALDTRDPVILANCIREGRDPTRVGIDSTGANTVQVPSVEITSGGSFALDPETSQSITAGFSFAEKVGPIDFAFNFNYYKINVEGAIAEPTGQFIVNQCFTRSDPDRSAFCDFITYDQDPASRRLITDVFAGFVNINSEVVKGLDFNADFRTSVPVGNKDLRLGLNLRANHLLQRDTVFLDSAGNPTLDQDAGEFGFPFWTGRATFTAGLDPWTFTWSTRMIGRTEQQADGIDRFSDAFGFGPEGTATGFTGNTCLGGGSRTNGVPNGIVAGDGVYCRDVGFAKKYFVSTASLRYSGDWFDVRVGVSNIFDRDPPKIDTAQVFGVANTPIGNGYDLNGREFFASTTIKF